MRHVSITEISELTDRDRSASKTVKKIGLKSVSGDDKREKLYNSARVLRALYLDEDSGSLSYAEVLRKLGISKIALNEQELQTKSAKVMPCEDYRTAFGYYLAIFRTFCVGHIGKTLLQADVDEAHKSLNDFLISQLPESEQPAARAAFEKTQIDGLADQIQWIRDRVEGDEHAAERDRLGAVVRAAYAAAAANPTRENLDVLEAGWRACDAHWKKSRAYAYSLAHQPGSLESDERAEKRYAEQRAHVIQRSRPDRGSGQYPA
jgi:hypothetical protein